MEDAHSIPAPIADLSPLTLVDTGDCRELVEDMREAGLFKWQGEDDKFDSAIAELARVANAA